MSWRNWGDHPIVVTVSFIAGLAGIVTLGYTIHDHSSSSTQPKSSAPKF